MPLPLTARVRMADLARACAICWKEAGRETETLKYRVEGVSTQWRGRSLPHLNKLKEIRLVARRGWPVLRFCSAQ